MEKIQEILLKDGRKISLYNKEGLMAYGFSTPQIDNLPFCVDIENGDLQNAFLKTKRLKFYNMVGKYIGMIDNVKTEFVTLLSDINTYHLQDCIETKANYTMIKADFMTRFKF